MSKCEAVPAAGHQASLAPGLFTNLSRKTNKNFKLLGAPIGDSNYCDDLTEKRACKAQDLLDAIADLPDPQVALLLLRHCGSFGKMVFAARTTPFDRHTPALERFDAKVRA